MAERPKLLIAVSIVGVALAFGIAKPAYMPGELRGYFLSLKKTIVKAIHAPRPSVERVGSGPASKYILETTQRMRSVPPGEDGGPNRSCDSELAAYRGKDEATVAKELPPVCRLEYDWSPRLRGYPESLEIAPGDKLNIFVSMRPDLEAQPLTQLRLRLAGAAQDGGQDLPVSVLNILPKACRSFWGSGCAFDQTISLDTTGLKPGGYFLEIKTTTASTDVSFVVRTLERRKIRVVVPDWTTHAYSMVGGGSFYWMTDADNGYQKAIPKPRLYRASTKRFLLPDGNYHDIRKLLQAASWFQSNWDGTELLTMSDLQKAEDLQKLASTLIFYGHNEYMTSEQLIHIQDFLQSGGNIINLSGNTAWWTSSYSQQGELIQLKSRHNEIATLSIGGDTGVTHALPGPAPESIFGTSYRFGGVDLIRSASMPNVQLDSKQDPAVTTLCAHPVFQRSGLTPGSSFGAISGIIKYEIDGLPVDKTIVTDAMGRFENTSIIRAIATTLVVPTSGQYYETMKDKPRKIGVMVEYKPSEKSGRVIGLSSIGAYEALNSSDKISETVIKNLVQYILDSSFNDKENLEGCPWQRPSD